MSFSRALEIVKQNRTLVKGKNILESRDPMTVIDTLTFFDSNELPAIYIINYDDDGDTLFQIIHADENVYPLIGYGEGRITNDDIIEGFSCWLNDQIGLIEYVRLNNLTFHDYITDIIEGLIAPIDNDPDPCEDCNYDFTKPPLMSSAWGQGCYYNTLLGACLSNCSHELTGCVATAMGQIMNYWDEPSGYYDWGLILNSYNFSSTQSQINEVSQLMKDIGEAVDMDWGCSASGAYVCDDAPDAFKGNFNYATANGCVDFSSWGVRNDINNYRPVLFRGENETAGHAWVCDGYREKCVCYPEGNYDLHYVTVWFHFNWGWNGRSNGWYLNNNFDGLYLCDQSTVNNIHP